MIATEQFHGHAGDFAEFHGGAAEEDQGFIAGGEGVEGMAAFVQECFDIALEAGGVHEDERLADFFKRGLISAGLFATATRQIQVLVLAQGIEILGQLRIESLEDGGSLGDEGVDLGFGEGAERGTVMRIDGEVPGAEAREL